MWLRGLCWALSLGIISSIGSEAKPLSTPEVTIRLFEHETTHSLTDVDPSNTDEDDWRLGMIASNGMQFSCGPGTESKTLQKSLESGCFQSAAERDEYWQYEVCLGSNVTQFHREGSKVSMRISLGNLNSTNGTAQFFTKGSGGRNSVVIFTCDSAATLPHLSRWEEAKPLHYVFHVATKAVCTSNQATLDGLACFERYHGGTRLMFCPGTAVTRVEEADVIQKILKYDGFLERSTSRRRTSETYESSEPCTSTNTDVGKKRIRVIYNCVRGQRQPTIETLDEDGCLTTIRIGLAHVCNIQAAPVDCRQVKPQ